MSDAELMSLLQARQAGSMEALLAVVTPGIHARLKESVAMQKWPDGTRLSAPQLENLMQLIILYEHQNLPEEQRTGYMGEQGCAKQSGDSARPLQFRESQQSGQEKSE